MLPEAGSYFGASSLKSVSQHPSLKPHFCLFQQVWDWLYLTPPSLEEHTSSSSAYLGALGFTKPLDKIVLCTIPLKSLLEWLSKTKDPNLVEATLGGAPEKALVLAVTKRMLYEEDLPSVGVGLVYKPHYVSTEFFCSAFMHLSMWHTVASSEDSTDRLDSAHFLLVSISEMSEMVPVALPHPVFLDVSGKEVVEKAGEPLAPHWFWDFRLHTVWSQPQARSLFIRSPSLASGASHHVHVGVRAGEVSTKHVAGAQDCGISQAPFQFALEHRVRPHTHHNDGHKLTAA